MQVLLRVPPGLGAAVWRSLHLREHRTLAVGVLSLGLSGQWSEIRLRLLVFPARSVECGCWSKSLVAVSLLFLLALVHTRSIWIGNGASCRGFRACLDLAVVARSTESLSEAVWSLVLGCLV